MRLLSLRHNDIDDECVSIFAKALRNNTASSLETLNLDVNEGITLNGFNCMLKLIGDTTSINTTYASNITLKSLGDEIFEISCAPIPSDLKNVCSQLEKMLRTNRTYIHSAAMKIWQCYFKVNNETFDIQPFLSMDVKVMPHLLGWFAALVSPT